MTPLMVFGRPLSGRKKLTSVTNVKTLTHRPVQSTNGSTPFRTTRGNMVVTSVKARISLWSPYLKQVTWCPSPWSSAQACSSPTCWLTANCAAPPTKNVQPLQKILVPLWMTAVTMALARLLPVNASAIQDFWALIAPLSLLSSHLLLLNLSAPLLLSGNISKLMLLMQTTFRFHFRVTTPILMLISNLV